jgi:hypothetical protein
MQKLLTSRLTLSAIVVSALVVLAILALVLFTTSHGSAPHELAWIFPY